MKDGVENYEGCNAMQSLRREKEQRCHQALKGTDSIGLLSRMDQSLTNKVKYSSVVCKHISAVLLCLAKIFRDSCVEKYNKFSGFDLSARRARTKMLASFEAGMNSPNLP